MNYNNSDKIQFLISYPKQNLQNLSIIYKKIDGMRSIPVVSMLTNRNIQNINTIPAFAKFKEIYNYLKNILSNDASIILEISNNNITFKKGNTVTTDEDFNKLIENILEMNDPSSAIITIGEKNGDARIVGGAKPHKRSNSTTKRRKKRSSKTRRL